mgnify:CR=1 FL=1
MIREFIETFRRPSAEVIAQRELEDAKRELLSAQSAAEYAKNMANYHKERIVRITKMLSESIAQN